MEAKTIDFSYGESSFIQELSASIETGKITTIIGPNGSGKSTLLNIMVNQLQPQKGSIIVDGKNIKSLSIKEIARKMAIVYQQNSAPQDLTVEKLVSFGRSPYQSFFSSKDEDEEEVIDWALEVTNLEGMKNKRVGELSGGERQRAWIAMALAQKTEILFLDEPTTYLDIYYQLEILSLVKSLNSKYHMTIVMVLHDINQAIQFSDNLIIMKQGDILYSGTAAEGVTEKRLEEVYGIKAAIRWCEHNQCPFIVPIVQGENKKHIKTEPHKEQIA